MNREQRRGALLTAFSLRWSVEIHDLCPLRDFILVYGSYFALELFELAIVHTR